MNGMVGKQQVYKQSIHTDIVYDAYDDLIGKCCGECIL